MLYTIYATVTVRSSDGYSSSVRQVPTFVVDDVFQGATSVEAAARIGMSVLTTMIPNGNEAVEQITVTASGHTSGAASHTETKVLLDPQTPGRMTRPRLRHAR